MCNCKQLHDTKLTNLKQKNSDLRAENRKLRKQKKRLLNSRNSWKENNKEKAVTIKQLRRSISRKGKVKGYQYDLSIIALCIQLRILAGCSYRSIRAILEVFALYVDLNTKDLPCANTVENWVSKMGLFCLQNSANHFKDKEVCLIIDESVKMGKEKALMFLVCQVNEQVKQALSYSDVEVCHLEGRSSWTGLEISHVIGQLKQKFNVRYVISDQAYNLRYGIRLSNTVNLPDISHLLANCLKKTFAKRSDYQCFIREINAYQAKSVNQDLTYLRPPKQRIKARFMNQLAIVKWAADMLMNFHRLSKKEQSFFESLPKHMGIISTLLQCLQVTQQIGTLFKKKGLSKITLRNAINLLNEHPFIEPKFKQLVLGYLSDYDTLIRKIDQSGTKKTYHACSDIIESMFGSYKRKMSSNRHVGLSILALELATYSTSREQFEKQVEQSLISISMTKLEQWKRIHTTENQASRRAVFFKNCPQFLKS